MKTLLLFILLLPVLMFSQPSSEGMFFDGVDDYFNVPGTTAINSTTTNNRTYETYFKASSTTTRRVLMKEGGGVRAVILYIENGYLVLGAYNRADYNPQWQGTFYRVPISIDTWYHVALVFDNAQPANSTTNPMNATANNALKLYVNGVLEADNSGYQLGNHNPIKLGYKNETLRFPNCGTWSAASGIAEYCFGSLVNDGGGNEYYFHGNIWGFRLWNDVRTVAEINDNMNTIITTVGTDNLVAALDGDTFTYIDSSGSPIDLSASNPSAAITWKSNAATTDWNTGTNWVGDAVPDIAKLEPAIIPVSTNYPVISSHIVTGDLEVQSGAEIIINDGGTLDVSYDLINDGTITINNNASLLNREGKPVSGTGSFVVHRDSPDYPADDYYSIWSTPVYEVDSEIGTIFTNNIIAYDYDASQNPAAYVWLSTSEFMKVGKGYFIRSDNDSGVITRTFTGTINNGTIDETIYFNSVTDNFNLIGNPYPSAINWLKFQADNSSILNGTMYYWRQSLVGTNNSASDYIGFNSTGSSEPGVTGNIGSCQGVFTESIQAGTASFNNSQRVVANNDQFFRTSNNPDDGKSWFRLTGSSGYSPILVGFVPGATDAYESGFDATFINEGAAIEFYSFIGSDKYEIQGRAELQVNQMVQIPLGYQVLSAGDYTISMILDYIDTSFDIMLEDTLDNTMTDLRVSDYTFNVSSPTEDNNRFILHYNYNSTLGVDSFSNNNININSVFTDEQLVTTTDFEVEPLTVEIYNLEGKRVLNSKYQENLFVGNLSLGVYVIKYTFKDFSSLSKKVIKSL